MLIAFSIVAFLLLAATLLPLIHDQHWFFRVWDFGKIQLMIMQFILFIIAFFIFDQQSNLFWGMQVALIGAAIYNASVLIKFTSLYSASQRDESEIKSDKVSIISVNVYQFNDDYERLIDLVKEVKPDILLTMESNKNWETALSKLDHLYKHNKKIAKENTYGMHFYTNLEIDSINVNYLVSDDIPSIECSMKTKDGTKFVFFGLHPPPPSPTEEDTSKERDGELMVAAKKIKDIEDEVVVVGDFNNVAWAKSSQLFKRVTQLIDPRIGRGFVATFHAKYWFMNFPIDLFFHSDKIYIEEFKTLKAIGSDHFPMYCEFYIGSEKNPESENVDKQESGDLQEMEEKISDGKNESGDREAVATE